MTLVAVTLTEEEQDLLLKLPAVTIGVRGSMYPHLRSIARKIREQRALEGGISIWETGGPVHGDPGRDAVPAEPQRDHGSPETGGEGK